MKLFKPDSPDYIKNTGGKPRHWCIELLIFALLFTIGTSIASRLLTISMVLYFTSAPVLSELMEAVLSGSVASASDIMNLQPDWITVLSLFLDIFMVLTFLYYCRRIDGRSFESLGLGKKKALTDYGIGFLLGAAMIVFSFLLVFFAGGLEVRIAGSIDGLMLAIFFLGFAVQSFCEEFMLRGYLLPALARKAPLWAAVLLNSAVFALLHILNPGISALALLNLLLFGIFASLYAIRTGSIWGVSALHFAWNFVQGNVLGVQVSGMNLTATILESTPVSGYELLNGAEFGLERGLAVTAVYLIGILLLLFLKKKPQDRPEIA